MMMERTHTSMPTLVLVGGFLGAGKTTLLLAAANCLQSSGKRIGIITNDQGGEIVDTRLARAAGYATSEITGGCFCCRFSDLVQSAENLASSTAMPPDVILAEPVGSCTDLSATILQPLKRFYRDEFHIAPLTVLVDPARAARLLAPDGNPHLSYLFQKQLAEADTVVFTKSDLNIPQPPLPVCATLRSLSAVTGEGVKEWLDAVLQPSVPCGANLLDIDYDRYAEAEAALGWLNLSGRLRFSTARTPRQCMEALLDQFDRTLDVPNVTVVHLKVFIDSGHWYLKASVCGKEEDCSVTGTVDAPPAYDYALTINVRALAPAELLQELVLRALNQLQVSVTVHDVQAFHPARPQPEYRFSYVAPSC